MEDIYNTAKSGSNLLAHAPTGLGKTDSALGATLTAALEDDSTVFFLTPKISQHKIAIEVAKGLAKKHKLKLRAVDLVGRKHSCIDYSITGLDHDAFYMQCEKKRKKKQCPFFGNAKGYTKLDEARADSIFKKILENYENAQFHYDLHKIAKQKHACPYEISIRLASVSNLIIADYMHFFIQSIRDPLFAKIKKQIDKSIIIVDEAHNLGKRVREHLSVSLNAFMLRRAEKEMGFLKTERVPLAQSFEDWAKTRLKKEEEMVVSKLGFYNFLSDTGTDPALLAAYLEDLGIQFIDKTNRKSACLRIANFIRMWNLEEEGSIRLLRGKGDFYSISKRMLDPSIATKMLNNAKAAILMSGTMKPLEMHRDVLGLDPNNTKMKTYYSPFDPEKKINIITENFTTKFTSRDMENYLSIARTIDEIVKNTPGGVAVFFASYSVQNAIVPLLKSQNIFLQEEKMVPNAIDNLLSEFRKEQGVLCGVQGGSLAEGIDYKEGEIKTVVIVGVALEEKSLEVDAIIDYYEEKFGKGWEYGYIFPAVVRGMQAAGRGVRKENDRCAVVFMDQRFKWKKYRDILETSERYALTDQVERYVEAFWEGY